MLRITTDDDGTTVHVVLEGRLVKAWAIADGVEFAYRVAGKIHLSGANQ